MRLLVRKYESGRIVRCLCISDDTEGEFTNIIPLDDSFQLDGGLQQYGIYGSGDSTYSYRELTFIELSTLKIKMYILVFIVQIN
jgi:hypothetical protein